MLKKEMREVAVNYCDGCKKESGHLQRCGVCKKEFCMQEGEKFHFAYSIDLYRYADGARSISHVCRDCADAQIYLSVQSFLDAVMGGEPVPTTTHVLVKIAEALVSQHDT